MISATEQAVATAERATASMLEQLNIAFDTQSRHLEHRRQQLVQQINGAAGQQLTLLNTQREAAEQVETATNVCPSAPM